MKMELLMFNSLLLRPQMKTVFVNDNKIYANKWFVLIVNPFINLA